MNSDETDILLVEDSVNDAELAIHALRREHLANNIFTPETEKKVWTFSSVAARFLHVPSTTHPSWCCSI